MKKNILFLILCMAHFAGTAQTDVKNTMVLLQECLNLNSNNQRDAIKLYEQIGVVEYSQANTQQRIKLSDLQKVEVNANNAGFSVDMKCPDENPCISFIRNDTSNSTFAGTAIQFSDPALANTFAENLSTLIVHYKTTEAPLEKLLFKNAQGKIPILGVKKAPDNKELIEKQTPADLRGTDDEPVEKAEKITPEDRAEARTEKQEEVKQKAAERKEQREAQNEAKKQARNSKKADSDEAADMAADNAPEEKPASRSKRKAARVADQDEPAGDASANGEPEIGRTNSRQKNKTSGNKIIEDGADNGPDEEKGKGGNDFCDQLKSILQSGSENQFKSIEGKLTNAETKINDSKIKLKGARKNYLSWYKKERAFISELKSGNDYETVLKEFEDMQTVLDECLGGSWDMEDKSHSEEYAKLKTEVRDVQFKKENDATMPAIRVIFLEDNEKFTMFMRIQK